MKNYIYSIIALLMVMLCPAQVFVSQAEYFWDTDPGTGNGIAVLASDGSFNSAFEQLTKTGITTPGNGLHKFSIRIKDNTGVWGPVFTNVINVQQNTTSTILALSQAEYFWDTDPGAGNGTPVLATDGSFDSAFEQLTRTGITTPGNGLHKLSVRIKDNTGVWGPVFTNVINVEQPVTSTILALSQAEYFWDTDPGAGNGTSVLAADGNFDSTYEQLVKTGIALPANGLHVFNIRIKDNSGVWGPVFKNVINIETPTTPSGCWQELSVGYYFSAGIKADGTLWTWGSNQYGQLGDGTTIGRTAPMQIGTANNWSKVVTGDSFTVALKTDGTLWAWGSNFWGQLGDGTTIDKLSPIQIGTATNWKSISAGSSSANMVALKTDGTLWAWGNNQYGQLGDGTTIGRNVPTKIGTATNWVTIGSGDVFTFAIKSNGTLWAWGYNANGQLGDGTTTNRNVPTQIGTGTNWKTVDGGNTHTAAVKTDGTLWAWGSNYNGKLGDGTTTNRVIPTQIGTAANWLNVSLGSYFTVATRTDGTLWAWGNNFFGVLGNGTNVSTDATSPVQVGSSSDNVSVSAGFYHVLVKNTDGVMKACGLNGDGQLGDGTNINKNTYTSISCSLNCAPPVQFSTTNITASSATINWTASTPAPNSGYLYLYSTHSPIGGVQGATSSKTVDLTNLLPDTTYYWWVASNCGSSQGNWTLGGSFKTLPTTVTNCWKSVAIGNLHSLGIKTDGTLWSWGYNSYGQLGDGTVSNRNTPKQIGTATDWVSITTGENYSLALKSNGTLWAWGKNTNGQIGDGTTNSKTTPTQIGTATDWVGMTAGDGHTLALKSNGTLWAWGSNSYGQLGDGTTINKNIPIQVGSATDWRSVESGRGSTLAIKTNGTLWTWGSNFSAELGDGTTNHRSTPMQIGTDTNWSSVDGGSSHSLGIKTDGTIWGWGANNSGQLGDGSTIYKFVPTQIGVSSNWSSINAGQGGSSVALKTDGTLWVWGSNSSGELGDGTTITQYTPMLMGNPTNRKVIAIGMNNIAVIGTDGFLTISGSNQMGQIGDGTYTHKKIFTPLACPTSTLSVTEVTTKADQLKVYPNPVQDILTVSLDQKILLVTVYNAAGQLILTKAINDTKGTIDFSALPSGVYMVKVNAANDFVKTVKVIKR
ncbi:T9SS C-terminal target domain-containing protein [Chryseobacterium sp. G0162]|uniref:RCC1 domain-containing protein n=1 Tax=Chryseobacterium sp. G0162 TaxID=2487063 RepID=UPI000F504017|nr:T9SS type A sorting domain-containing protein [Chryseobacterium sp. G0162]AZB10810.1 T9SS C-terminal target domain-containing protein [Chryseobacterium sp. G0162]